MTNLTRREMLKRTVVAGAAAAWSGPRSAVAAPAGAAGRTAQAAGAGGAGAQAPAQPPPAAFETLTVAEGAALQAMVARIIPADDRGPGAREAGAAIYIDRALAGPLATARTAYRTGLAALDRHAQATRAARFAALAPDVQDALLRDLEQGVVSGGAAFFELVRTHTIEGTFADPAHGGNVDFIGWRLLGYPGVRTIVPPDLQRIDRLPPARQVSAYDFPAFAAARARRTRGG